MFEENPAMFLDDLIHENHFRGIFVFDTHEPSIQKVLKARVLKNIIFLIITLRIKNYNKVC